jgi:hypothetical protein
MTTRAKPFAFPSLPLQLFKVSTESVAAGKVLPRKAKQWEGVYVPALGLIVAADPVPGFYGPWKEGMAIAAKATVCGIKARKGHPTLQRLEYALLIEDDRCDPAVDDIYFRFGENRWEWTSTSCAPAGCAWLVGLGDGNSGRDGQSSHSFVRAVCAGQTLRTSVRGA